MDRAVAVDGTLKQPTRAPKIAIRSPDSFTLVGPLHRFRAIADMPVVGRGSRLRSCGTLTAVRHAHTQNAFNKYCAVRLREVRITILQSYTCTMTYTLRLILQQFFPLRRSLATRLLLPFDQSVGAPHVPCLPISDETGEEHVRGSG